MVAGTTRLMGRYFALACALAVLAAFYPLLGHGVLGLGLWTAAFWLVLLGVLRASSTSGSALTAERALATLAALGSLGTVAIHHFNPEPHSLLFAGCDGLALAFLGIATIRLMGSVLFGDHSRHDHLLSAACAYVLLGLVFAYALIVLDGLTGTPQIHVAPESRIEGEDPAGLTRARFLYLSFVTLTTLGYGDMTAVTLEARVLLGVESVLGQLFLAIMVARLIALHTSAAGGESA